MKKRVVNVPIADLRRDPLSRVKPIDERDHLQESQLIFGEVVELLEERKEWARVAAVNQPFFNKKGEWQGYPGWVKKNLLFPIEEEYQSNCFATVAKLYSYATLDNGESFFLPIGCRLPVDSVDSMTATLIMPSGRKATLPSKDLYFSSDGIESNIREKIVATCRLFVGSPYFWGGRGPFTPKLSPLSGVDCSALIDLSHKVFGMTIPRNAHDQCLLAKKVAPKDLNSGDLIFLADKGKPDHIHHVMLYLSGAFLIEASGDAEKVRELSLRERLGLSSLSHLSDGEVVKEYSLFFRSFLTA